MLASSTSDRNNTQFASHRRGARFTSLLLAITTVSLAGTGCLADEPDVSSTTQAATVSSVVGSGCSTAIVLGLSKQIADEIACEHPTLLTRFEPTERLQLTSNAVLPYLAAGAKTSLESVATTRTIQVNSAFRTVAQQYLLYRWGQQGRCGIGAVAPPGRSNHETGRALDVQNYSSLISALRAKGWSHSVPGDPVHFDHLASPDSRGKDVAAFQRLWNRNNPSDKIASDGMYGPGTEARLKQAPATGFALGPSCGGTNYVADVVAVDGPDRIQPLARAQYTVTLENNSQTEWPASAILHLANASSTLRDPSWLSSTEIAALGAPIPAGGTGTLTFTVTAPDVTDETPVFERLEISDGTARVGSVHLALTVVPGMEEPTSGEADDHYDYDQEISGGCSTSRRSTTGGLLLVLFALISRRRQKA